MSIYPCDIHGQRVRGSLAGAYVTVLHGPTAHKRRLRLCPDCIGVLLDSQGDTWIEAGDNPEIEATILCSACREECRQPSSDLPVFVTVFPGGGERRDYFGSLHGACAAEWESGMGLVPQ